MSDSFDYIDDHTKLIIDGYIRNAQKLLTLSFNQIPTGISLITLSYVDDHFMMYRGSYQWKIKDKQLIQNILTAQPDQLFASDVFEIGKLKWIIKVYPNGNTLVNTPHGRFDFFVEILSMPSSWDHILVLQTFKFEENNTVFTRIHKYKSYEYWGWDIDTLLLNNVNNLNPNTLTFTVHLKILRIVSKNYSALKYQSNINNYRKKHKFRWIIPKNNDNTWIFSPIFGEMFCIYYQPTASTVGLRLCSLPNEQSIGTFVDAIQVKWTLNIIETDITFSTVGKLGYDDYTDIDSKLLLSSFNMNDYQDYNEFTFMIDVEILNEYDLYGNIIGVNVEDEWEQFINKESASSNGNKDEDEYITTKHDPLYVGLDELNKTISRIERVVTRGKHTELDKFGLWLMNDVKLTEYYDVLLDNGFDSLDAIATTNIKQLKDIGIKKIGHRQQLMKHIRELNYIEIKISPNTLYLFALLLFVMFLIIFNN